MILLTILSEPDWPRRTGASQSGLGIEISAPEELFCSLGSFGFILYFYIVFIIY